MVGMSALGRLPTANCARARSRVVGTIRFLRSCLTDRISAAKALRDGRRAANSTKDKARRPAQIARLWQLQMLVS